MPERFRGELLTMDGYTNPASFTFFTSVSWYVSVTVYVAVDKRAVGGRHLQ